MKGWIKTGLLAVAVYAVIYIFNYLFLNSLPESIIIRIVNAPVYFLLQLFGVVSPRYVFFIGVAIYFLLGVLLFFIAEVLDAVTTKLNFFEESKGSEVTKRSMGIEKKV